VNIGVTRSVDKAKSGWIEGVTRLQEENKMAGNLPSSEPKALLDFHLYCRKRVATLSDWGHVSKVLG